MYFVIKKTNTFYIKAIFLIRFLWLQLYIYIYKLTWQSKDIKSQFAYTERGYICGLYLPSKISLDFFIDPGYPQNKNKKTKIWIDSLENEHVLVVGYVRIRQHSDITNT